MSRTSPGSGSKPRVKTVRFTEPKIKTTKSSNQYLDIRKGPKVKFALKCEPFEWSLDYASGSKLDA